MKPPYAESTVYQKYRKTGIDKKKIRTIKECLNACSNFYKVIELDEAWKIVHRECSKSSKLAGVDDVSAEARCDANTESRESASDVDSMLTTAEFDALVPIFERDSNLDFYLESESELYADGKDKLLLIDKDYLCVKNSEFTEADIPGFVHSHQTGELYDGPYPFEEDWDIFFELDKQRQGKGIYIPDDLMKYADPYFPETPQVEAMRKFLVGLELKVGGEKSSTNRVDSENTSNGVADSAAEDSRTMDSRSDGMSEQERLNFRADVADAMIYDMHTFIRDVHTPASKAFPIVLEVMNATGYKLSMSEVETCMDLFTDLSNNTRMPSNGGYTPNELMRKYSKDSGMTGIARMTGSLPRQGAGSGIVGGSALPIDLGSGFVDSIRNGEIDGNEQKRMIMANERFPMEFKIELLKAVDKAMKEAGKIDMTAKPVVTDMPANQKIGRNDPCPCGSGKKYKNCCGKLN